MYVLPNRVFGIFSPYTAGLKYRSQDTGYRSQVTGHRLQVKKMKHLEGMYFLRLAFTPVGLQLSFTLDACD